MELRILGPLEVSSGDGPLPLGGPNQRALLALLLLHANAAVSRERLIDDIWGESPPKTAEVSLNGYVSRLRKLLRNGDGVVLETRSDGYALVLDPERLDVTRFQRLIAEAREARLEGRPGDAEKLLEASLALWRGRALADLEYAPFAQSEIARLEELRLGAIEDRIETQLELGRHSAVVGDLERLVVEHPYRERLRAQLMLALYQGGNQAAALELYRSTRKLFADELGIEPGAELQRLEHAILNQDPTLEPRQPALGRARPGRIPRRRGVALAVLLVGVAIVAGTLALTARSSREIHVRANSLVALDVRSGRVLSDVAIGSDPEGVAAGDGAIWVSAPGDETLVRVDPRGGATKTLGLPDQARGVVAGKTGVWPLAQYSVMHVAPAGPALLDTTALPRTRGGGDVGRGSTGIALGNGAVWVGSGNFQLLRLDPSTGSIVRTYNLDYGVGPLAFDDGSVWMVSSGSTVVRFVPAQGITHGPVALGTPPQRLVSANAPVAIAIGAGAVWALVGADQALWRIDPTTMNATSITKTDPGADAVAVGEGSVWVTSSATGTIVRVDPSTGRITKTVDVGHSPSAVAVADGKVWVTVR